MKKILLFVVSIYICLNVKAQLSTGELPISFSDRINNYYSIDSVVIPKIKKEEIVMEEDNMFNIARPFHFGVIKKTKLNMDNSGTWRILDNDDKMWQLRIKNPGAKSINLIYDYFWIPKGSKFFIYSPDKKQHIGAFTSKNNKSDRDHVTGFATGLLAGDEIVLEYYQPHYVDSTAIISISKVVCGFRNFNYHFLGLGESCPNQVNINCSEGQNWQNEKKAVACILQDNYFYTGSLINTTLGNCQPLLLTANHNLNGYDAISSPNLNNLIFYWNYEYQDCNGTTIASSFPTTSGATIYANNSYSDFALLHLIEDPQEINNYTPYYLGWDISDNNLSGGVCIHHPKGDSKKIATKTMYPSSAHSGTAWYVTFAETANGYGIPETGSSGAALLNNQHRIIGQLNNGSYDCNNPDESIFYFGKLSESWVGNGSNDPRRRLFDWLNPNHINVTAINGKYPDPQITGPQIVGNAIICDSALYYVDGLNSNQTVVWTRTNLSYGCSFQTNYPLPNQCMVKYTGSPASCTLVATIYQGNTQITQLTKDVHIKLPSYGSYSQEACTFYGVNHPAIPNKNIVLGNAHFVHQGCRVQVVSEAFRYMTISHNGYPPSEFSYNGGNTVTFSLPYGSGGAPFIIQARGEGGCFDFDILFFSISGNANVSNNSLNISPTTEGFKFCLVRTENDDISGDFKNNHISEHIPWILEIYNLQDGQRVLKTEVCEEEYFLNSSNWKNGNYAVRAILDNEIYTNKIRIDN